CVVQSRQFDMKGSHYVAAVTISALPLGATIEFRSDYTSYSDLFPNTHIEFSRNATHDLFGVLVGCAVNGNTPFNRTYELPAAFQEGDTLAYWQECVSLPYNLSPVLLSLSYLLCSCTCTHFLP